jgi:hypothetical protein
MKAGLMESCIADVIVDQIETRGRCDRGSPSDRLG